MKTRDAALIYCVFCGAPNTWTRNYCKTCGERLPLEFYKEIQAIKNLPHCANCGNLLMDDERHKSNIYKGPICDGCYDVEKVYKERT